jgi:hypothetical protein
MNEPIHRVEVQYKCKRGLPSVKRETHRKREELSWRDDDEFAK